MFNKWRERMAQNKKVKEFEKQMSVYKELEKWEKHGEFSLNMQSHQVLIEESLSMVMMVNAKMWTQFLSALYQYAAYKYYQIKYDEWRTREGAKAVMDARKKYAMLTRADVMRIKQARWKEMQQDDVKMENPEPIEFYLVRLSDERKDDKKNDIPAGEVTIVGRYDYESGQMEMATWQKMNELIKKRKNKIRESTELK